ncbi:AAA family ATPase, partial [Neisseria cinerea]
MKKADVLDLIKYHFENKEAEFRNQAITIARSFDKAGDSQLAQYIIGLISQSDRFVPQNGDHSDNLVPVKLDTGPLPLPTTITNDLKGIINAVNHNIGINKFLFVGSPGTGKTESAKQIARLLNRELLMVDFSHLVDSKLGQTAKNLTHVFGEINKLPFLKNYIILFDEIDTIALDRINQNDIREMGRVTSTFLKALDSLNPDALIIATTNLYSNLDKALVRRFDATIDFDRYSEDDRIEVAEVILNHLLKQFKHAVKDMRLF